MSTGPGSILSMMTGALLVALGLYIWFVAPRTRQNLALAAFTAGWGVVVVTGWLLTPDDPWVPLLNMVSSALMGPVVAVSAVVLAWNFGGREAPNVERRRLLVAAPLCLLPVPFEILVNVPSPGTSIAGWGDGPLARAFAGVMYGGWSIGLAGVLLLLVLAALRYPWLARERPSGARSVLMLTFGLGAYLGVVQAVPLVLSRLEGTYGVPLPVALVYVLLVNGSALVLACIWVCNVVRTAPPWARRARWAAWTIMTAMLASLVLSYNAGRWTTTGTAAVEAFGILRTLARLLAIATFTYAILRTQLLGIDVKARWTISRSTIAAVFLAVFFVTSEAAQQFFGDTIGSTYAGIAAAGVLVFAIAPLQRLAERFAAKAVPVPHPAAAVRQAAIAYKAAVRAAQRDGMFTRREERHLAEVAKALGIDPVQALQWRDEVEAERSASA